MAKMDDFEKEDGKIDWDAYNAAQIRDGEKCYGCRSYIVSINRLSTPSLCYDCKSLRDHTKEEVLHSLKVRCPYCRKVQDPYYDSDGPSVDAMFNREGDSRHCGYCEQEFKFGICVQISYSSPPVRKDEEGQ